MNGKSRRGFLADIGRGMLAASVGTAAAAELGLSPIRADDNTDQLKFGSLEPLVGLMQDTPPDKLLEVLTGKIAAGMELKTLVAAGALANARTFAGHDYTGYHALMALAPALEMASELPTNRQALPVLKVLYRNTKRMIEKGGKKGEQLRPMRNESARAHKMTGEQLRDATRRADLDGAERVFASIAEEPRGEAFNHLQFAVQDEIDVHRVVLAWRAWSLLDVTGPEHAQTLFRQSVRFCVDSEKARMERGRSEPGIRTTLPKLLDQFRLLGRPIGNRPADDALVAELSKTICNGTREQAAEAVAGVLADGFDPEAIGEAMSLACTQLVLRDPGRVNGDAEKPKGSVHGASVGVHAADSAHAWRNIARVSNPRNTMASLIVGAYHTAGQTNGLNRESMPLVEQLAAIKENDATGLLRLAEAAIRDKDQVRACAAIQKYGTLNQPATPVFEMLLGFACSEDGALHAEKYYRTVVEEFATTRPAMRWQHLAALARVTASEFGFPAPGYAQACRLLKV